MIIDEAHNCESQLMNFISLSISDKDIPNLRLPKFDEPEDYAKWMLTKNVIGLIDVEIISAVKDGDIKRADDLKRTKHKYDFFMASMTSDNPDPWVAEYTYSKGTRKVEFKPVYVSKYAQEYLFNMADTIIMMSATILDVNVLSKSLGISKDQIAAKRMKSRFPLKNHPIYYEPVVKVTGGNKQKDRWGPKLVEKVNEIGHKYPKDRGIIHTHNFSISKILIADCDKDVSKRFMFQKDFKNKTLMLAAHGKKPGSIIVAPAMHEGLDLKDDLSRFQVICKVPFPNFYEDKQLAARMQDDEAFYNWLVALKLVQSAGRSVRSETDHADTYIIDGSFTWWYKSNEKFLPAWFKNAIKW
jgi:Rad3-related DNA helicase